MDKMDHNQFKTASIEALLDVTTHVHLKYHNKKLNKNNIIPNKNFEIYSYCFSFDDYNNLTLELIGCMVSGGCGDQEVAGYSKYVGNKPKIIEKIYSIVYIPHTDLSVNAPRWCVQWVNNFKKKIKTL